MKLTLFLCVFLAVVSIAFCAQVLVRKEPGTPGDCFYIDTGAMHKGEVKEIKNKCIQARCGHDGTIALYSCGAVVVNDKRVEPDYSKSYPACCNYP